MTKEERELIDIFIMLLKGLGVGKVQAAIYIAIIQACKVHQEMADWAVTYYGKESNMTIEAFTSKLNELTGLDKKQIVGKSFENIEEAIEVISDITNNGNIESENPDVALRSLD